MPGTRRKRKDLLPRLKENRFTAAVIGLGYVGLPVAVAFGRRGRVIGFDISAVRVAELRAGLTRYAPLGALVAGIMIAEIAYVVWYRHLGFDLSGGAPPLPAGYSNTKSLGAVLYTDYALPFQLAAVVLLVAIVAAITLTMRRRVGFKQQDIGRQVATRKEERLRIVKVEPEERR